MKKKSQIIAGESTLLDNKHLKKHGIEYFAAISKDLFIVTSNPQHPAYSVKKDNVHILYYPKLDLKKMMEDLYDKYSCHELTIQSGSTLNAEFMHHKLIDYLDVVVAPILIGGDNTSSLIGGESLKNETELSKLGILKLEEAETLKDSYLRLKYKVIG